MEARSGDTAASGGAARALDRQIPELPAAAVDEALRAGERHAVDGLVRVSLVGAAHPPARLVSARDEAAAVGATLEAAAALVADGVRSPAMEETAAALRQELAALATARTQLIGVEIRGATAEQLALWDELVAQVHRAEALTWRLAFIAARELGGPAANDALLERLPDALAADARGLFARLAPTDPDYAALLRERLRLQRLMVAVDGPPGAREPTVVAVDRRWPTLRHGDTFEGLALIRQRLAELGEPAPPVGEPEQFDASLDGALRRLQRQHSLEESGTLSEATLEVLRTPLGTRLEWVEAALQALRTHPLRGEPDRLQVNIPAFELRVFLAGRLVSRHRAVVGNNNVIRADGAAEHVNRTPVIATRLTDVVLNPSWYVPRRIKELELDPLADRNPAFYDDFDLWVGNDGVERAIQLPGRRNALGRVKFVIAGAGGVFLHDTPNQRAFTRRARAISHGCVRVEGAVALMRRLLDHDRHQVDAQVAQGILAGGREVIVTLNRSIPTSLDYLTVGTVGEGGSDGGSDGDTEGREGSGRLTVRYYPDIYGWGPARVADGIIGSQAGGR